MPNWRDVDAEPEEMSPPTSETLDANRQRN